MKKFFKSEQFNITLAVVIGILAILQEVWIGNVQPFINNFLCGALIGSGASGCAEIIKVIFADNIFSIKDTLVGCAYAIGTSLVISLLLVL